MKSQVRFGNLVLTGSRAQELADAATAFSQTPEGKKVAADGAAAGRKAKEMFSQIVAGEGPQKQKQ